LPEGKIPCTPASYRVRHLGWGSYSDPYVSQLSHINSYDCHEVNRGELGNLASLGKWPFRWKWWWWSWHCFFLFSLSL